MNDLLTRGQQTHGIKFSPEDLSEKFVPYYNSGQRIEVEFPDGTIKRGTVGVTTGWKPIFILMLTKRSRGSSWSLHDSDKIKGVIK